MLLQCGVWVIDGHIFVCSNTTTYVFQRGTGGLVATFEEHWPFSHAQYTLSAETLKGQLPADVQASLVHEAKKSPRYYDVPYVVAATKDVYDFVNTSPHCSMRFAAFLPIVVLDGPIEEALAAFPQGTRVIVATRVSGVFKHPLHIVGESGMGKSVFVRTLTREPSTIWETDSNKGQFDPATHLWCVHGHAPGTPSMEPPPEACVIQLQLHARNDADDDSTQDADNKEGKNAEDNAQHEDHTQDDGNDKPDIDETNDAIEVPGLYEVHGWYTCINSYTVYVDTGATEGRSEQVMLVVGDPDEEDDVCFTPSVAGGDKMGERLDVCVACINGAKETFHELPVTTTIEEVKQRFAQSSGVSVNRQQMHNANDCRSDMETELSDSDTLESARQHENCLAKEGDMLNLLMVIGEGPLIQFTFECEDAPCSSGYKLASFSSFHIHSLPDGMPAEYTRLEPGRYRATIDVKDPEESEYVVHIYDSKTQTQWVFLCSVDYGCIYYPDWNLVIDKSGFKETSSAGETSSEEDGE